VCFSLLNRCPSVSSADFLGLGYAGVDCYRALVIQIVRLRPAGVHKGDRGLVFRVNGLNISAVELYIYHDSFLVYGQSKAL
jgi:hypothetical protein